MEVSGYAWGRDTVVYMLPKISGGSMVVVAGRMSPAPVDASSGRLSCRASCNAEQGYQVQTWLFIRALIHECFSVLLRKNSGRERKRERQTQREKRQREVEGEGGRQRDRESESANRMEIIAFDT